jgi:hypothetical protein
MLPIERDVISSALLNLLKKVANILSASKAKRWYGQ